MENKINIAEILKDCPQGMELDCTLFDDDVTVIFDGVDVVNEYATIIKITVIHDGNRSKHTLTKYGQWNPYKYAKCVIFPKGKTTWEGFVPPCEFKKESEDDERMWKLIKKYVHYNISDMALNADHITREQLESWLEEQDKKELMNFDEAEKEKTDFVGDGFIECHADFLDFKEGNTYWLEYIGDDKYNVRSDNLLGKTYHITPCQLYTIFKKLTWLEKQSEQKLSNKVKPKFKVGDRIKHKNNHNVCFTITNIEEDSYFCGANLIFGFDDQNNYELVIDKFDITTLKPFDKVLTRANDDDSWVSNLYSHRIKDYYVVLNAELALQCIPYEGNEHLLGKTDNCSDFYKTWK